MTASTKDFEFKALVCQYSFLFSLPFQNVHCFWKVALLVHVKGELPGPGKEKQASAEMAEVRPCQTWADSTVSTKYCWEHRQGPGSMVPSCAACLLPTLEYCSRAFVVFLVYFGPTVLLVYPVHFSCE